MMSAVQISVVDDLNAPGDGYAIVRLVGVPRQSDDRVGITVEQTSTGPEFLGPNGWQAEPCELAADNVIRRGNVLDLLIGPAITDHLLAGTRLRLSIDALGLAEELTWPRLAGAGRPLAAAESVEPDMTPRTAPGPLAAPSDPRAQQQSGLRAEPRSEGDGKRREPRLGRPPDRPRSLAAVRPTADRPARATDRRTARPVATRRAPAGRPPSSPTGGQTADTGSMPWEWSDQSAAQQAEVQQPPQTAVEDEDTKSQRAGRKRPVAGGIPLPWKIVGINLVVLIVLGAVGYAMVFNGWDPVRMLTGDSGDQVVADREGPSIEALPRIAEEDGAAIIRQRALDALAVAITGPVGEARTAIEQNTDAQQIFDLAATFQNEGDPATALRLFEYAAVEGNGAAERAIGRMADPVHFEIGSTAFTRPNAELAVDHYRRALALGDTAASADLDALQGWLQRAAAAGDQEAQNALLLFNTTEL